MVSQITYKKKRILVAPLFWGLGHATRCIPIIDHLLEQNNTIAIASDGDALRLLQKEYPHLDSFELPSYGIEYRKESMLLNMGMQSSKVLRAIQKEEKAAAEISNSWNADVIISDNRLGFRAPNVENIYITHQLNIPAGNKLITRLANIIHHRFINKFDQCWVPDFEGEKSLAGSMSKSELAIPIIYLGALSRLVLTDEIIVFDYTAILSGPEPQRTKLEEEITKMFNKRTDLKLCIVRGTEAKIETSTAEHITVYDLLDTKSINKVINQSSVIICRSGYTSIMDLIKLNKKAILIPTPGQYEQEYLSKNLNRKYRFTSIQKLDELSL